MYIYSSIKKIVLQSVPFSKIFEIVLQKTEKKLIGQSTWYFMILEIVIQKPEEKTWNKTYLF